LRRYANTTLLRHTLIAIALCLKHNWWWMSPRISTILTHDTNAMDTSCVPRQLDISREALRRLARACDQEAGNGSGHVMLSEIRPSELLDEIDAAALDRAVQTVLSGLGLAHTAVHSWRLIRASCLSSKPVLVQDLTPSKDSTLVCALLCITGEGRLSMTRRADILKPTAKMHQVKMEQGQCVVYSCNVTCAVYHAESTYLHCVCAGNNICNVLVHCPVKFPCPFNVDVEIGDIRVYPRTYEHTNAGVCKYRGARWKNVLDHLAFCKANPKKEKYRAAKEARQAKSNGEFQCDQCDHPPFVLKNSLVQHRTRKHAGRGLLLPPAYLQITSLANEDITPYDTVDESLDRAVGS
jgi:hypothetical protein